MTRAMVSLLSSTGRHEEEAIWNDPTNLERYDVWHKEPELRLWLDGFP